MGMPDPLMVSARRAHRELVQLLTVVERGEPDESALQAVQLVCNSVIETLDDPFCHEKMREVMRHSEEYFRLGRRPRWGRSTPPGVVFVRRLVFRALEAFDERLRQIEKESRLAERVAR